MCGKVFHPENDKKYYHEYDCNIRSRLGSVKGKRETWFGLKKGSAETSRQIITEIDEYVIPAFDVLSSRDAILAHRRDYPLLDTMNRHLILLEECMIYGHLGNPDKAKELFELYYQSAVDKYNKQLKKGTRHYLKKGQRIVYMGQDITASKSGYVTVYGANHRHIDYLDELALKLDIR